MVLRGQKALPKQLTTPNQTSAPSKPTRRRNAAHKAGGAWLGQWKISHQSWHKRGGHMVTPRRMLYRDRQVLCLQ